MSLFVTQPVPCPQCGGAVEYPVNFSVNGDRRPDFRLALLDGSFQRETCPHCEAEFRLAPEMTYLHVAKNQWILVRPAGQQATWPALEQEARDTFELAYGTEASPDAQAIGAALQPRVVFGWAALREKLVCAQEGLDDVTLELMKLLLLRSLPDTPLNAGHALRLGGVDGDNFSMAWIREIDETLVEALEVPRGLYDDVVAQPAGWAALRGELSEGTYVDMARWLVDTEVDVVEGAAPATA